MEAKSYGIALGWPLAPGQAVALLVIAGTPVVTATQDQAYTGFTVTASGGTGPYVYSLAGGSWPTGISMNASTGVVSGTPTAAATYAGIIIRATDVRGYTANLATFQILVAEPVGISGTPVTTATKDAPYDGFTVSGAEGTTPYAYSLHAGTLPTGITLDAATGEVAGTPSVEETKTGIVIRVTDAYGSVADLAAFQIAVSPAIPAWLPQAPSGDYAVAFADFANGHYWGSGAETNLAGLVTDPAAIVAGGMDFRNASSPTAQPAAAGGLYSAMMGAAGYTLVIRFTPVNTSNESPLAATTNVFGNWNSSDYGTRLLLGADTPADFSATTYIPEGSVSAFAASLTSGVANAIAVLQNLVGLYAAVNGTSSGLHALASAGLPSLAYFNIGFDSGLGYADAVIASIAIYAPQPASDLPALST